MGAGLTPLHLSSSRLAASYATALHACITSDSETFGGKLLSFAMNPMLSTQCSVEDAESPTSWEKALRPVMFVLFFGSYGC